MFLIGMFEDINFVSVSDMKHNFFKRDIALSYELLILFRILCVVFHPSVMNKRSDFVKDIFESESGLKDDDRLKDNRTPALSFNPYEILTS